MLCQGVPCIQDYQLADAMAVDGTAPMAADGMAPESDRFGSGSPSIRNGTDEKTWTLLQWLMILVVRILHFQESRSTVTHAVCTF